MTKVLCSIFDCKAEVWSVPQCFMRNGEAIRAFEDAVNSDTQYGKHAEDFTLFAIGEFNELSGEIVALSAPQALERGINLVKGVKNENA